MSQILNQLLLNSEKSKKKANVTVKKTLIKMPTDKIDKTILKIEEIAYNLCYVKGGEDKTPGDPIVKRQTPPDRPEVVNRIRIDLLYNLTLSLLINIYGNSEHVTNFQSQLSDYIHNEEGLNYSHVINICLGKIEFLKAEIELGILKSIRQEITGEIVTDFLHLSRQAITDDSKEVAGVLACASLEDVLKKHATSLGINIENKSMSDVVNLLKANGAISSAQSNILKGYSGIRNKVFHAEWDKFDKSDINSIIGFTEQFVMERFK